MKWKVAEWTKGRGTDKQGIAEEKGGVIDGTRKNHLMWGETSHEMNRGVDTIINLIYGKDREGKAKAQKG